MHAQHTSVVAVEAETCVVAFNSHLQMGQARSTAVAGTYAHSIDSTVWLKVFRQIALRTESCHVPDHGSGRGHVAHRIGYRNIKHSQGRTDVARQSTG